MKLGPLATQFQSFMIALALMSIGSLGALAQEAHSHTMTSSQNEQTAIQKSQASALLKIVRGATDRFHNVAQAEAEGYALQFGCVSGESSGAMGLHFVNGPLVNSGVIDPAKPQIVIYEPTTNGNFRLIGADYLVVADTWNAHHSSPPELMGQLFHLFDTPNRFGLPAFYSLHVWAWKDNPNGAFVNWHPNVNCQSFAGEAQ